MAAKRRQVDEVGELGWQHLGDMTSKEVRLFKYLWGAAYQAGWNKPVVVDERLRLTKPGSKWFLEYSEPDDWEDSNRYDWRPSLGLFKMAKPPIMENEFTGVKALKKVLKELK